MENTILIFQRVLSMSKSIKKLENWPNQTIKKRLWETFVIGTEPGSKKKDENPEIIEQNRDKLLDESEYFENQ